MTSSVSDTWEQGDSYEHYIGRWSRCAAPPFLSWLDVPPDRRWLDVGSGTGALCAAIADHCEPGSVIGLEPSSGFLSTARARTGGRVTFVQGSASNIPLEDDAVDVVVSALVLNFIPDQLAALREMERVACPGGSIGAYVWDYAGQMQLIRFFWDAAIEVDPRAAEMDEALRFPLCRPEALSRLFTSGGLTNVHVTGIEVSTPFTSFEEYWRSFLGGQGPAPTYLMSLNTPQQRRLRDRLRERVPVESDGSILLVARAWAVRGTVPMQSRVAPMNQQQSVILRDLTEADIPALAELHVRTFRETHGGGPGTVLREQQWRAKLASGRLVFCVVLETRSGNLIGFASGALHESDELREYRGELNKIYLLQAYQRLGFGRRLLCTAAARFLESGVTSMLLFGDAASPSNGFYEAMKGERLYSPSGEFHGGYGWNDLTRLTSHCGET